MAIKKLEFPVWTKREYSEQEIINFSAELEKYRIWGKDPFDPEKKIKYLSIGGEYSFLQDKKIIEAREKIKNNIYLVLLISMSFKWICFHNFLFCPLITLNFNSIKGMTQ